MLNSIYSFIEKNVWSISVLMLVVITIASLLPLPALPDVPGSDKTHHLISYAAVVLPIFIVQPKHWPFFIVAVIAWSGAIELIQPFVNRYGEWLDLLANAAGVLVGGVVGSLIKRFRVGG